MSSNSFILPSSINAASRHATFDSQLSKREAFDFGGHSVDDAGICINALFLRLANDDVRQCVAETIDATFKRGSGQRLVGDPTAIVSSSLSPEGKRYFDVISGLKKRLIDPGSSRGDSHVTSQLFTPFASRSDSSAANVSRYDSAVPRASDAMPFARHNTYESDGMTGRGDSVVQTRSAGSSQVGGYDSRLAMGPPSVAGAASAMGRPVGASRPDGYSSNVIGAASATRPDGAAQSGYNSNNPFAFLHETNIPFEALQQISMTDQPVTLSMYMRSDNDVRSQMAADYSNACFRYRRDLPSDDVRNFGGNQFESSGDGMMGDQYRANAYQLIQIANMRERYKAVIRENDKTLGRTTPATVDDLSITQLIEYHSRQQSDLIMGINSWMYNSSIVLAGGLLGGALDGKTGVYYIDRYMNFSSFPDRLKDMRSEPWWNYSIRQLSQNSFVGSNPTASFAMMLGMALANSAQDGLTQHNVALKERPERTDQNAETQSSKKDGQNTRKSALVKSIAKETLPTSAGGEEL